MLWYDDLAIDDAGTLFEVVLSNFTQTTTLFKRCGTTFMLKASWVHL